VKRKNSGFTVVELLTVVVIISILIGLLLPGIGMVRNLAKTTQQKAQFVALELGIEAFKNDYGEYPESKGNSSESYMGGQKLAEAMVGRDMLGFHPDTDWGENGSDYKDYYRGLVSGFDPEDNNPTGPRNESDRENYEKRKDPYLELESSNVFRLQSDSANRISGLYDSSENTTGLDDDSLVLCDVFKRNNVTVYLPNNKQKMIKAGNPILYYRANLLSKDSNVLPTENRIHDAEDNWRLIRVVSAVMKEKHDATDDDRSKSFDNDGGPHRNFYTFVSDPKIAKPDAPPGAFRYWPYNSKTYILISAGRDGLYGTEDDICNFDK